MVQTIKNDFVITKQVLDFYFNLNSDELNFKLNSKSKSIKELLEIILLNNEFYFEKIKLTNQKNLNQKKQNVSILLNEIPYLREYNDSSIRDLSLKEIQHLLGLNLNEIFNFLNLLKDRTIQKGIIEVDINGIKEVNLFECFVIILNLMKQTIKRIEDVYNYIIRNL